MNVLVTGGAGFVGSHLVDALVARGDRVVVLDELAPFYDPALTRRNLEGALASGRATLVRGDVCSPKDVARAFDAMPIEAVAHLAARVGVRASVADPAPYVRVNVEGIAVVLEHARQAGVKRFVFSSSSSVYGIRTRQPFREEDRVDRPLSPYAATKVAGELLCATYSTLHHLPTVALRLFTVYGPRQRPDLAIARFARQLRRGEALTLFGDGSSSRDYTYVEDTVRGILASLDRPWPEFEVVNLGGADPIRLSDLVTELERTVGRTAVREYLPAQPGEVPLTHASIVKAEGLLGWKPRVSLAEGLARYLTWLDSEAGAAWR